MKIAIIGTGGVGGYYGGYLARAGNDVTFVARGDQYNALKQHGLWVKSVDDEFHITPVKVVEKISDLDSPYLVIFATKSYDRDAAAQQLAQVATQSTIIISLINGVNNDRQIAKFIKNGRVYPGLAYIVSARTAPGYVEQTAGPRTVIFGDRDNPINPELKEIESVMQSAGILATASTNIDSDIWEKFLWITVFAGVTGMQRKAIGLIVNDLEGFDLCIRSVDEGISIARALGVKLAPSVRDRIISKMENYKSTGLTAKSSLLVDLENNRKTEIEDLSGILVRYAADVGISSPLHENFYRTIKAADTL